MSLIQIEHITRVFTLGDSPIKALDDVSLTIEKEEFVAIVGTSGSGKSTLMNVVGCLDKADSGEYLLEGLPVRKMNRNQLADMRNKKIGFVFQGFNLLARTSALENVMLPLMYDRGHFTSREIRDRATEALSRVGLENRLHHEPSQLSGGQQQRVAIARALVNQPAIILADEPTGNLDSHTTGEVLQLFTDLNKSGITIVLVTHEMDVAEQAKRIIEMRDGRIKKDHANAHRDNTKEMTAAEEGRV